MRIGIIGAGNIGGALTRRFRELGYEVAVANSRGPETLASLVAETGAEAVGIDAISDGRDVVVVAVPTMRLTELDPAVVAGAPIVVDTGNYYPRERDGRIADLEASPTESGWVEKKLGRPVIKTFNAIIAEHLRDNGLPVGSANRIGLAVAGDDAEAKAVVMDLVDALGFDPVDGGSIAESWRQQPGTPVYLKDYPADGVRQALAEASPGRTDEWRGTDRSPGTYDAPA